METENNNTVIPRTPAQEVLVTKIIQSRKILDKEYQQLVSIWKNQVVTSKDAAVFIEHVLATLRFRRYFLNGRHKASKKCLYCGSRDDVRRYWNVDENSKTWVCETCALNLNSSKVVPVKESN